APALKDPNAGLLPDVTNVRDISVKIAAAVIRQAVEEGLQQQDGIPCGDEGELEEWIREQMWDARYRPLRKVDRDEASAHAKGEAGSAGSRGG
ncbi:NAD-dependent malic enzyme, mitochondrial, partial [Elasticomyces elasticus]